MGRSGEPPTIGRTDGRIHFVCVRADHRPRATLDSVGPTVHEGAWAFCRDDAAAGHAWVAVRAIDIVTLRRALAHRDPADLAATGRTGPLIAVTRAR